MKLTLENVAEIDDPSAAEIATALSGLTGSDEKNRFAIILQAENADSYIQVYGSLHLEYRDGSADRHYRAQDSAVTLPKIIEAFQRYARGDDAWKLDFVWERMEFQALDEGGGR